jgi:hypothetical protein
MGFAEFFGWNVTTSADELPELFGMPITQTDFVKNDVVTIYSKILTDVLERTQGIPEEKVPLLWDNCLKSSLGQGLVTMLAGAMAEKKDLFLVFDKATDVLRPATETEKHADRSRLQDEGLELSRDLRELHELPALGHGCLLPHASILHDREPLQVDEREQVAAIQDLRPAQEREPGRGRRCEGSGETHG